MDATQLLDLVKRYQDNRSYITNEEMTKMALVVPFIRHLGYDPNFPREVRPEFAAEFTQGDGKRFADRMDYAIFDPNGTKPLLVIETKPLDTDLKSKSQQLARYIAQMPDLHFGIITDGCRYLFYGDLDNPNQMDSDPFFAFSLDDPNTDWTKAAKFLSKFSRNAFNAETLATDAENSRYRQAIIEKLSTALKHPASNEGFMKWLTEDVYKGKRTAVVMERLCEVVRESIESALMLVLEDDFLDKLKDRFQRARDDEKSESEKKERGTIGSTEEMHDKSDTAAKAPLKIVTTEEELIFYETIREICASAGIYSEDIVYKDTVNYFNVSFRRPTKWFLRFFDGGKQKSVVTPVPVEEAKQLAVGFEVVGASSAFGLSRVFIKNVDKMRDLKDLILKSLEVSQFSKESESALVQNESGSVPVQRDSESCSTGSG